MRKTNSNANEDGTRLSRKEQVIRIERQNIIGNNAEGVNEEGPISSSQWEWKYDNRNDKSTSNEVATPPHGLSGGEHASEVRLSRHQGAVDVGASDSDL